MEDLQLLRERCEGMSEADLVRSLTLESTDNSETFRLEAQRELAQRGTTVAAWIDRVKVRAGSANEGEIGIDDALALVDDKVPRRAIASFTHCLGETLVLQREGWGWVLHHYAEERYGRSYLIESTATARRVLQRFVSLESWLDEAGQDHHLDDWKTFTDDEEADSILALSDRLTAAGVPHIVRPALFTPPEDKKIVLLVPHDRMAEATQVTGTGQASVRQVQRQAQDCDQARDQIGELAAYDELTTTDGDNHAVHYNRGVLLLELGRHEEAAAAFMEATARGLAKVRPDLTLGRGPTGVGILGLVGVGARILGRAIRHSAPGPAYPDWFDDVELRLQAMLDHFGNRPDLLHSLASLALVKGDSATAIDRYQVILAFNPNDEVARFQLEYLAAAHD